MKSIIFSDIYYHKRFYSRAKEKRRCVFIEGVCSLAVRSVCVLLFIFGRRERDI